MKGSRTATELTVHLVVTANYELTLMLPKVDRNLNRFKTSMHMASFIFSTDILFLNTTPELQVALQLSRSSTKQRIEGVTNNTADFYLTSFK